MHGFLIAQPQAASAFAIGLQQETDVPGVTQNQIEPAREEVARDIGW
jgi:hypothetical protein